MQYFFPKVQDLKAEGLRQEDLHNRAFAVMKAHFGPRVFVRGVVEVSNFCRENCHYCGMRRGNKNLQRFRLSASELCEQILEQRPSVVTDLNIQTGEDPVAVREVVLPLLAQLRKHSQLGLSVCLGTLNPELYGELKAAGASIYIMKFELADPALYTQLEAPGSLEERTKHIRILAENGWVVSSGFIAGLGSNDNQLLANFTLASQLPLSGCSVSPFITPNDTPMESSPGASIDLTLNCMAALRLMQPQWVIPAVSALNMAGSDNSYEKGLRTGANLATINLTPGDVREDYLLYKRNRLIMTEEKILRAIDAVGLEASTTSLANHYKSSSPALAAAS